MRKIIYVIAVFFTLTAPASLFADIPAPQYQKKAASAPSEDKLNLIIQNQKKILEVLQQMQAELDVIRVRATR